MKSLKTEKFKIVTKLDVNVLNAFLGILAHLQHKYCNRNVGLKPCQGNINNILVYDIYSPDYDVNSSYHANTDFTHFYKVIIKHTDSL